MTSIDDARRVSPALEKYAQDYVLGDSWKRPGLSPRDRSLVTLAVLIARNQTIDLPDYLELALDHGLKLRSTRPPKPKRAHGVGQHFGAVAPGVLHDTTDILFRDLWLRPDLAPRDRSLVTVSALAASGQMAQMGYHLNRAMDNGLAREEASAVFSTGWTQ